MKRPTFKKPKRGSFWCEEEELDLAHALGLNISLICRTALQEAIGRTIQQSPNIPEKTVQDYIALRKQEHEERTQQIKTLTANFQEKQEAEQAAAAKQESLSDAVSRVLKGGALQTAYRRLPMFDRYGDYDDYWQELAASVSGIAGFPVDESELKDYVRKHGGNRGE